MPYETFAQLEGQMLAHFQNNEYAEALELILAEGDNLIPRMTRLCGEG